MGSAGEDEIGFDMVHRLSTIYRISINDLSNTVNYLLTIDKYEGGYDKVPGPNKVFVDRL